MADYITMMAGSLAINTDSEAIMKESLAIKAYSIAIMADPLAMIKDGFSRMTIVNAMLANSKAIKTDC
jgi:hypothetical protein